ncbi:uncharacterized protein BYT42DRAFT_499283 [Radiomyces spectabilis]|uniref:uncharacterized protein n=1 Tax=Radiomyces spectabilis TaxID=64574 RepID=UPI00221E8C9A|nr:uncharacterized protein BYT42DRAFT_499283 [Radiomyces spectabilis]KAI8374196.1 hypothetical protein BYT42DRAFT_499283 [Radiomyces spectabilis]
MSETLYSQRPEWADIIPVKQDDGPNPLVPIAYSADSLLYVYISHRQYRQAVLFALESDLEKELDYIDDIALNQSKNYQVWHHRQVIVDKIGKCDRELPFINSILDEDSKNYHAWSYRQWVVSRFSLWDQEFNYTDDLLTLDVRNNSAWNYRFFVLFRNPVKPTSEQIDNEIELFEKAGRSLSDLKPFLDTLRDKDVVSPHTLSMYIDVYEQEARNNNTPVDQEAFKLCDELATKLDPIRHNYWSYRKLVLAKQNK